MNTSGTIKLLAGYLRCTDLFGTLFSVMALQSSMCSSPAFYFKVAGSRFDPGIIYTD